MRRLLFGVGSAIVLIVVALFFIAQPKCCDSGDGEYAESDKIAARALSGDLPAIRILYDQSVIAARPEDVHRWALLGALAGDESMHAEFLKIYRALPPAARTVDDVIIRKNSNSVHGAKIARELGIAEGSVEHRTR